MREDIEHTFYFHEDNRPFRYYDCFNFAITYDSGQFIRKSRHKD